MVSSSLDQRVMGISAEQFFTIPRRIAVSGGDEKLDAVRGALRGGWINVLITDRTLAQQLVDVRGEPDESADGPGQPTR